MPGLSLCLLVLLAFGDARAQTITSLEDTEVGAPDSLRLNGTGFLDGAGTFKGFKLKVRLVSLADGKSYKTKFVGASDTTINTRVSKAPPGEYIVRVSRKGVPDFDAPQTLTVFAPEPLVVSSSAGFGCGRTKLFGRFLGILPGKVRVGGKRAKVIGWQAVTEVDGEPSNDHHNIIFVMPRGLGPGPHDVELRSLAGSTTLEAAVSIQDTDLKCRLGGKSQMAARLDAAGLPKKMRSKGELLVGWTEQSLDDEVAAPLAHALATVSPDLFHHGAFASIAGAQDATTLLGTARKGKAVRVIACVIPGWEPDVGAQLQGEAALALDPVVVLLDLRIQGQQLVLEGSWGGFASEVDVVAHFLPPSLSNDRVHVRFSAESLDLVEGSGAATVSVTEALILNARHVNL
ncbi:MAG: hypothetical protein DHS20C15_28100 [Planctomycetota bacterium]|nr:MAG: hypothetical protein DHS20C15_28100 [Planctomycetota bacterium]